MESAENRFPKMHQTLNFKTPLSRKEWVYHVIPKNKKVKK